MSKFIFLAFFSSLFSFLIASQAIAEPTAAQYQQQIDALTRQVSQSDKNNRRLSDAARAIKRELAELRRTAGNAIISANENNRLKIKLREIEQQRQLLSNENSALKRTDQKQWFLAGAAVLFGGILLGLFLPRLRLQRKSTYSQF